MASLQNIEKYKGIILFMLDNNYYDKYIQLLSKLTDEQIKEYDLLNIFCEYISSNPEFKYNGTYLRDSINDFKECLNQFIEKRKAINNFINKLSQEYDSLEKWYIIIDNLYVITPECKMELLLDFDKNVYFRKFIHEFNLYTLNTDNVSIRYVKLNRTGNGDDIKIDYEYSETQKIKINDVYKQIELNSMVKKTLTAKDNLEVGENNAEH